MFVEFVLRVQCEVGCCSAVTRCRCATMVTIQLVRQTDVVGGCSGGEQGKWLPVRVLCHFLAEGMCGEHLRYPGFAIATKVAVPALLPGLRIAVHESLCFLIREQSLGSLTSIF